MDQEQYAGLFFLDHTYMTRCINLGFKKPEDIPRHHPLLIHLYEQDKEGLAGIACRLNMKEVKENVYTIISKYGKETVMKPDEFKWVHLYN